MQKFKVGQKFEFGNAVPAVVVQIVDADLGEYECGYLQNRRKIVKDRFRFDNDVWNNNENGRVLSGAEASKYRSALKIT